MSRAHLTHRVAFQGEHGAFSEEAVVRLWGDAAEPVPMRGNRDVARAVVAGVVDRGVLPLENSVAGAVADSYDALADVEDVRVVGEIVIPIRLCVLGLPGATIAGLRRIESHPMALAQCREFLARHPHIVPSGANDTAGAARDVAASGERSRAALASRVAAVRNGLVVLAEDVHDHRDNATRFVVLSRRHVRVRRGVQAKTILVITPHDRPGGVAHPVAALSRTGVHISRLQSRPTGSPWSSRLVVELEHFAHDSAMRSAIRDVRSVAHRCRAAGTFPRAPHTEA
jgi:prephenate dehydratase